MSLVGVEEALQNLKAKCEPCDHDPAYNIQLLEELQRDIDKIVERFGEFKRTHIIISEENFEETYERLLSMGKQLKELGVKLQDCVIVPKEDMNKLFGSLPLNFFMKKGIFEVYGLGTKVEWEQWLKNFQKLRQKLGPVVEKKLLKNKEKP